MPERLDEVPEALDAVPDEKNDVPEALFRVPDVESEVPEALVRVPGKSERATGRNVSTERFRFPPSRRPSLVKRLPCTLAVFRNRAHLLPSERVEERMSTPIDLPAPEADALFDETLANIRTPPPRATYRLQLQPGFGFDDARRVLPYLRALGVGAVYASPFFQAREGSTHGYDITRHDAVSEALGGEGAFERFAEALRTEGLGLVVDFVPNHMGIGSDNAWWVDVLENGPSSPYATFFDIDWRPYKQDLENKVLLPILGAPYGEVLEEGALVLEHFEGSFFVRYGPHRLPVNPRTYVDILDPMLEPLVHLFGDEDDRVLELQSIITGLVHLPPRTEKRRARVKERQREKEILKKRLTALLGESAEVRQALRDSIERLNGVRGVLASHDALHALLEQQAYRLSFWRTAAEEINYRRFFDINDLAAIRMEEPLVFERTHARLFKLYAEGIVTGIRIDHPDGLWDPGGYFAALQEGCFLTLCRRRSVEKTGSDAGFDALVPTLRERFRDSPETRPAYVLAEKILSRGESLPDAWPLDGTTGYDFAADVGRVFTDPAGETPLLALWRDFTGARRPFEELVYEKKKLVLDTSLASELTVLASVLDRLSERDRHTRDFTLGSLQNALREVIACFPVYRTYVTERTERVDERDRNAIEHAVSDAMARNAGVDASVYRFVENVLLLNAPPTAPEQTRKELHDFVLRFQQLTGPVMAKGVEDTAFYIWNPLVSLNEVGGEPERFALSVGRFHELNVRRQARYPASMLALSTHDTKRSADVRARIGVLSERPEAWKVAVEEAWREIAPYRTDAIGRLAPDENEVYLLLQTVVGTLPFEGAGGRGHAAWVERLVDYMRKATKEAKVHTSWINAAPDYDRAVERFVRKALDAASPLWKPLSPVCALTAFHGAFSSLSQTLLQLTCPGVPDVYQGNEGWDFSLVDPDNRRLVDYAQLRERLERVRFAQQDSDAASALVETYTDGRLKTLVTHGALTARARLPAVFARGARYEPLDAEGEKAPHVVAFLRAHAAETIGVVVPRLTARLADGALVPPMGTLWENTRVSLPQGKWLNLLTGQTHSSDGSSLVSALLDRLPVALLERRT